MSQTCAGRNGYLLSCVPPPRDDCHTADFENWIKSYQPVAPNRKSLNCDSHFIVAVDGSNCYKNQFCGFPNFCVGFNSALPASRSRD